MLQKSKMPTLNVTIISSVYGLQFVFLLYCSFIPNYASTKLCFVAFHVKCDNFGLNVWIQRVYALFQFIMPWAYSIKLFTKIAVSSKEIQVLLTKVSRKLYQIWGWHCFLGKLSPFKNFIKLYPICILQTTADLNFSSI